MFAGPEFKLARYVIGLSKKRRPNVAYFPHASDNNAGPRFAFYEAMRQFECMPSTLSLFDTPPHADLARYVLEQDVIFVGGGNTKSMVSLWRAWGLDALLRRANRNGAVLAGVSAGGNCWFDACVTDSLTVDLTGWDGCLGFLKGAFCPHYDGEAMRRPTFHRLVASGALPAGVACDDHAAAHFENGKLKQIVAATERASGYRVRRVSAGARETRLPVTRL
jgi:peptidase E